MTRIGFIGVGRMGLPMCANLVRAGYQVTAGDARGERESAVTGCGAQWKGTAAEVAAEADVLITVLPGPGEVHDVMAGRGGVLAALPAAATWIDMTSSSPEMGGYCFMPRMPAASVCSRLRPAAACRRPGQGSCSYS